MTSFIVFRYFVGSVFAVMETCLVDQLYWYRRGVFVLLPLYYWSGQSTKLVWPLLWDPFHRSSTILMCRVFQALVERILEETAKIFNLHGLAPPLPGIEAEWTHDPAEDGVRAAPS